MKKASAVICYVFIRGSGLYIWLGSDPLYVYVCPVCLLPCQAVTFCLCVFLDHVRGQTEYLSVYVCQGPIHCQTVTLDVCMCLSGPFRHV